MYVLQLSQIGNPKDEEELPELYHWAQLFQATTWEEIKMLADKNEDMKECMVTMKKLTADEKMRQQLEAREKLQRDMVSAKEMGFQMGLERGMEQGIEQGIEQLIMNSYRKGETPEAIAEFMVLPLEKVKKIISEH